MPRRRRTVPDLKKLPGGRPHVQDGRGPFDIVSAGKDSSAGLTERSIHRLAVSDGGVEFLGEDYGRSVADLELHGYDGWNPLLHQALGDPGEGVRHRATCPFARVEDHQSERVVAAQHDAEILASDQSGPTLAILEHQRAVLRLLVEAPVAHEMKDVILALTKWPLQTGQRCIGQSGNRNDAALGQVAKRTIYSVPFGGHVELGEVGGIGNHHQDIDRR